MADDQSALTMHSILAMTFFKVGFHWLQTARAIVEKAVTNEDDEEMRDFSKGSMARSRCASLRGFLPYQVKKMALGCDGGTP